MGTEEAGASTSGAQRVSRRKQLFFKLIVVAVTLLGIEAAVRGYFAMRIGPDLLLYGIASGHRELFPPPPTPAGHHVGEHDNERQGYFKYFPHQHRSDVDIETGETFPVTINASGFRGEDFPTSKDAGVIRIVTLGASSTFGYYGRDDETYPHKLELELNRRHPAGPRYEVLNLGIPHATSAHITALFQAEGLPLQPDIVTFYEGVNDAASSARIREKMKKIDVVRHVYRRIRGTFITVALADHLLFTRASYSASAVERHVSAGRTQEFIANLEKLRRLCENNGISLIVASQQAKSKLIDREDIAGMTYAEEAAVVREKLARDGEILPPRLTFLTHADIMAAQRDWVQENNVLYADVIDVLDQRRDVLVSWVHLSPEGNALIANALADAVDQAQSQDGPPQRD